MMIDRIGVFAVAILAVGCGDKSGDTGIAGLESAACGDPCTLRDPNNFTYDSELSFEVLEAQAAADVCIDWSGMTTDIQGQPFTEGIDVVRLAVFGSLGYDEIREGLVADSLQQSQLALYMECEPGGPGDTDCCLSEFGLLGSYPGIDTYFTEGSGNWLFTFDTEGVDGTRTMVMLQPSASSDVTGVDVVDDMAALTIDADLASSTDALIAPKADIEVDWSGLTVDGMGYPLALERIDRLELGHYAETPEVLAEDFFELRNLAIDSWSMDVGGQTSANLSGLSGGSSAFSGVTSDGTWLLALWCSACENPVPKAIVVMGVDE